MERLGLLVTLVGPLMLVAVVCCGRYGGVPNGPLTCPGSTGRCVDTDPDPGG